jgi:ubiquinol-cytochrome c reductase cytochrome b/c1 subunit
MMMAMLKSPAFASKPRLGLAVAAALALFGAGAALAAEGVELPVRQSWTFSGPIGHFDRAQLQRGFKVYREVCSNCHSLSRIAFRNLSEPGGPEFTEGQVKGLAAEYEVPGEPDDTGEVKPRKARPADHFPPKYKNDNEARANNNGAAPPDLSLMAKARGVSYGFPWFIFDAFTQYQEGGPDYIHALIADGYLDEEKGEKVPEGITIPEGLHYNKFFPGHAIAMPNPLQDGQVEYTDGTPATVDQYSRDLSAFLMWTAEPRLEERKELGLTVMLFLIIFTGLLYFTKRKVWHAVEAH